MADPTTGWHPHHGHHYTPHLVPDDRSSIAAGGPEDRTEILAVNGRTAAFRPMNPHRPVAPMMGPATYPPSTAGRYPYPFAPAPARKGQISLRLYSIGAAVLIATGALAVVAMGAGEDGPGAIAATSPESGSVGSPVATPTVGTADLEGLLRDELTLGNELGIALERRDVPGATTLYTDTVDQPACTGAVVPASRAAYDASGWLSVRKSILGSPDLSRTIYQAVVSFPTAERAAAFVAAQTDAWQSCDGHTIILDPDDEPLPIDVASVNTDGTTLTAVAFPGGASEKGCDRALRAAANVVIDVQNCGAQPSQDATRIAAMVNDQVPAL